MDQMPVAPRPFRSPDFKRTMALTPRQGISFSVFRGEIFGLVGLMGGQDDHRRMSGGMRHPDGAHPGAGLDPWESRRKLHAASGFSFRSLRSHSRSRFGRSWISTGLFMQGRSIGYPHGAGGPRILRDTRSITSREGKSSACFSPWP